MSKKFPYGYDIEVYIDKAIDKMRDPYFWVTKDNIDKRYKFAIEKIDDKYKFVLYGEYADGSPYRTEYDWDAEEFYNNFIYYNEWSVKDSNPVIKEFKVPFEGGTDAHGWYLEIYNFRLHELGSYSTFVQAGDRTTGGSREFYLPQSFFGGTFEEFLDKYMELVPGGAFGLYRSDLENTKGLKEFLGF